jgi:hypothetical protein
MSLRISQASVGTYAPFFRSTNMHIQCAVAPESTQTFNLKSNSLRLSADPQTLIFTHYTMASEPSKLDLRWVQTVLMLEIDTVISTSVSVSIAQAIANIDEYCSHHAF